MRSKAAATTNAIWSRIHDSRLDPFTQGIDLNRERNRYHRGSLELFDAGQLSSWGRSHTFHQRLPGALRDRPPANPTYQNAVMTVNAKDMTVHAQNVTIIGTPQPVQHQRTTVTAGAAAPRNPQAGGMGAGVGYTSPETADMATHPEMYGVVK